MSLERMQKARVGLITSEPFFGTLASKLSLVEDPKAKTTWTDGKLLGFNPEWSATTPMPQLEASFAHHVLSCAWGHQFRRGSRDRKLWQEASDYVVNLELQRAGFKLPEGALVDPKYSGLHVEAVYRELDLKRPPPPDDQNGQGGGGTQGEPGSPQSGQGEGEGGNPQPQPPESQDERPGEPEKGAGGSGDEATGTVEDATDDTGEDRKSVV